MKLIKNGLFDGKVIKDYSYTFNDIENVKSDVDDMIRDFVSFFPFGCVPNDLDKFIIYDNRDMWVCMRVWHEKGVCNPADKDSIIAPGFGYFSGWIYHYWGGAS